MNAQDILSKLKAIDTGNGHSIQISVGSYFGGDKKVDGYGCEVAAYLHLPSSGVELFKGSTLQDLATQIDIYAASTTSIGASLTVPEVDAVIDSFTATKQALAEGVIAEASLVAPSTPHPDEADEEHAAYLAHAKQEVADDVASKCYHDTRS